MSSSVQHFAASSKAHERRVALRLLPKSLIYVACGESNGGMVLNVSDEGLAVSMAIAVSDEAYSHLNVRMNGLPQSIEVPGRMVWTTKSKKRAGIQLTAVTDTQREQIREWIALDGVRDVNLLPRAVSDVVASNAAASSALASSPDLTASFASPAISGELRSTLLDAFGGTAPETLGPPLPELFAFQTADEGAPPVASRSQGFDDVGTAAFRENEWDLASVTVVPRKKPKPEGLSAFALIVLWIAIPSFGIGILVGRRPLVQWLSRGDAVGKTFSRKNPSPTPSPAAPDTLASTHQTDVKFSQEIPSNLPVNTEPLENDILAVKPIENYRSGNSAAAIDARLLNSMSTQEARAYKNIATSNAPAPKSVAAAGRDSKPNLVVNSSVAPQSIQPVPQPVQSAAVPSAASSNPAPGHGVSAKTNTAAPLRTQNINASPLGTTPSSSSIISKSVPASEPVQLPSDVNSTVRHENAAVAVAAAPPANVPTTPAAPAASSPNFSANRNSVPGSVAKNPSPTLSASNLASSAVPPATPSVAPNVAPRLAPLSVQPALHGVMTIARSTDQAFILKLPAEALPGGQAASMRMQRFVMVPQRGHWHHHSAIAKVTVGELLTHVPLEKTDAKIQSRTGDTVTVRAFVAKDGAVQDLKPVSGRFALMPRVMRTVRGWHFDQTLVDGKPVESEVNVTVEYRGAN